MRNLVTLVIAGLVGLLGAASIGYAAYVVSRDTVGTPVTKVKLSPNELAPARTRPRATARTSATTTRATPPPPPATTVEPGDDHGGRGGDDDGSGRGRNRGRGGVDDD